jgi:hypothetical protein
MYFNGCHSDEKEALLPNGTKPLKRHPNIPPHYASIWVEPQDLDKDKVNWWPRQTIERTLEIKDESGQVVETSYVSEFRIPEPATVTFPDKSDKPVHFHRFETDLPRLQEIDDVFEVDLDTPDVIARVSIRGGKLRVYKFKRVASVKWTIEHTDEAMEIKANQYSITLKPHVNEIVFSNNSDLLSGDYQPGHDCSDEPDPDNHFYLYSRIEKDRDGSGLVIPCYRDDLRPLVFQHAYLRKLASDPRLNDSGCTGSCC